jgi:hypothetical protein
MTLTLVDDKIKFFAYGEHRLDQPKQKEIEEYIYSTIPDHKLNNHIIICDDQNVSMMYNIKQLTEVFSTKSKNSTWIDKTLEHNGMINKNLINKILLDMYSYVIGDLYIIKPNKEYEFIEKMDKDHGYFPKEALVNSWQHRRQEGRTFFYTGNYMFFSILTYITKDIKNEKDKISLLRQNPQLDQQTLKLPNGVLINV